MIRAFALNFNGRINTDRKCLTLCCEPIDDLPASTLEDTPQETIERFIEMCSNVIKESKEHAAHENAGKRLHTAGCANCANYIPGQWDGDGLIHYINLSMYPAPCQSKCIYCGVHSSESGRFTRETCSAAYEQMFDALDYARKKGLIAPGAFWQVSSGEIAIHPYRERIFNLVADQRATFFTNCFIFDEKVAENLSKNPNSAINFSIDAGTPQTWLKVKGVDNFKEVTENLAKYFGASSGPGQITLKYIILPGINDNMVDFLSVIGIMKVLRIKHLTIARDTSKKYEVASEESNKLLNASAYLLAMLYRKDISADMFTYTPNEREKVVALANELLHTGKV